MVISVLRLMEGKDYLRFVMSDKIHCYEKDLGVNFDFICCSIRI